MPRLALERQSKRLSRVGPALLFRLANHPGIHDRGFAHLLFDDPLQVFVGASDLAQDPKMAERVGGLSAADLPENLRDLRVALLDGSHGVRDVHPVGFRLFHERHPQVAVRPALLGGSGWRRQAGGGELGVLRLCHRFPPSAIAEETGE